MDLDVRYALRELLSIVKSHIKPSCTMFGISLFIQWVIARKTYTIVAYLGVLLIFYGQKTY